MATATTARAFPFQGQALTLDQIADLPETACPRALLARRISQGWAPEDAALVPAERQLGTPFHPRAVPYLGDAVAFTFRGETWSWEDFSASEHCEVTLGTLRKRVSDGVDPEVARLSLRLEQERRQAQAQKHDLETIVEFLRGFGSHIAAAPKVIRHVLLDRARQQGISTAEGQALIDKLLDSDRETLKEIYEELGLTAKPADEDQEPASADPPPRPETIEGFELPPLVQPLDLQEPDPFLLPVLPGEQGPVPGDPDFDPEDLKDPPIEAVLQEAEAAAKALGDDAEGIEFLLGHYQAELVQRACCGQLEDVKQACSAPAGDAFMAALHARTLGLLGAAEGLPLPEGYTSSKRPSLIQRITAVRAVELRSLLVLLDVGLGKTLAATLATRAAGCRCTVVICPSDQKAREWAEEIRGTDAEPGYFRQAIVRHRFTEALEPAFATRWDGKTPLFLLFTVDDLRTTPRQQQRWAQLLKLYSPDGVVFDEVHLLKATYAESEEDNDSKGGAELTQRRQAAKQLVRSVRMLDPRALVLGLTGTAVLNELREGRSLAELVCDTEGLVEIAGPRDLPSATRLYQAFVRNGVRLVNTTTNHSIRRELIDASHLLMPLVRLKRGGAGVSAIAGLVADAKIGAILDWVQEGDGPVVIYSQYVSGVVGDFKRAAEARGLLVGLYTGQSKEGTEGGLTSLDDFKAGALDVLLLSSAGGTGINGLQAVSHRIAFLTMPWTWAALMQAIGRLDRLGQGKRVEAFVPEVAVTTPLGRSYSWCDWLWRKLESKRVLATAAVDGLLPASTPQPGEAETKGGWEQWVERILSEGLSLLRREPLKIPPFATAEEAEAMRRRASYSDFSRMNRQLNQTSSAKTHADLQADPMVWQLYQSDLAEHRKVWTFDPLVALIEEFRGVSDPLSIGDFGCGQAQLAKALASFHDVQSFDHVAADPERVIPCNIVEGTGLKAGSLDVVVLCLALMCSDWPAMLAEAHRCLRYSGSLRIWEATSRWESKPGELEAAVEAAGFNIYDRRTRGKFIGLSAVRR